MNSLPRLEGFKMLQLQDPISTTNAESFIIQGQNHLTVQNFSFHRHRLKMNTYLQCGFECRVHLQRCLHNETRPLNSWNFKISEKAQESSAPATARGVGPAEKRNTRRECQCYLALTQSHLTACSINIKQNKEQG